MRKTVQTWLSRAKKLIYERQTIFLFVLIGLTALLFVFSAYSGRNKLMSDRERNQRYVQNFAYRAAGAFTLAAFSSDKQACLARMRDVNRLGNDDLDVYGCEINFDVEVAAGRIRVWSKGPNKLDENGQGDDLLITRQLFIPK
jgi:hypothetical protein